MSSQRVNEPVVIADMTLNVSGWEPLFVEGEDPAEMHPRVLSA